MVRYGGACGTGLAQVVVHDCGKHLLVRRTRRERALRAAADLPVALHDACRIHKAPSSFFGQPPVVCERYHTALREILVNRGTTGCDYRAGAKRTGDRSRPLRDEQKKLNLFRCLTTTIGQAHCNCAKSPDGQ